MTRPRLLPRELPGLFWDEERQRYFPIQQHHIAAASPASAKYSEQNVKNAKRQKLEHERDLQHKEKVEAQTFKRSPLLQSPDASFALGRELGHRPPALDRIAADNAWFHWLSPRPTSCAIVPESPWSAIPVRQAFEPCWKGITVAVDIYDPSVRGFHGQKGLLLHGLHPESPCYAKHRFNDAFPTYSHYHVIASFQSSISSVSLGKSTFDCLDPPARAMFATAFASVNGSPNAVAGALESPTLRNPIWSAKDMDFMRIGGEGEVLWTSAMSPEHRKVIVGSSATAHLLTNDAHYLGQIRGPPGNYPEADWIDENTAILAYSSEGDKDEGVEDGVRIWDVRHNNISLRWHFPRRRGQGIRFFSRRITTGLRVSKSNINQVLVCDNRQISVYDRRFIPRYKEDPEAQDPVVKIHHEHEGRQIALDCDESGRIAAADTENVVKLYSSHTGKEFGRLLPAQQQTEPMYPIHSTRRISHLCFEDDINHEPVIRACQGHELVTWKRSDPPGSRDE